MQDLAVKESRLGIPLLIGYDVIHGHRDFVSDPLGRGSSFDPEVWDASARESAQEAAADGLAMTFAPMLDVAAIRAGAASPKALAKIRWWARAWPRRK